METDEKNRKMNKKGYEGSFMNIVTGFVLMSLFGLLIITAVNEVGVTYSKNTSEISGGALDLEKFNDSISGIETSAKNIKASFDSQSVWSAIAGVVVEGIFGISRTMALLIFAPFDILYDILLDIFGIPYIVTSVILALLIFSIIIAIWRLIRIGE